MRCVAGQIKESRPVTKHDRASYGTALILVTMMRADIVLAHVGLLELQELMPRIVFRDAMRNKQSKKSGPPTRGAFPWW